MDRQKAIVKIIRQVELIANCTVQDRRWKLMKEIIQALAALKSEPDDSIYDDLPPYVRCPGPQPVEPSEFTEEAINYIYGSPCMSKTSCKGYAERLERACGFIGRQAATIKSQAEEIKDLKECKAEPRPNPVE